MRRFRNIVLLGLAHALASLSFAVYRVSLAFLNLAGLILKGATKLLRRAEK